MNKKVFISMLVLTISFLVSFYVLKIFFPQEFVMSIQNEQLIKIGTFIDTHKWAYYLMAFITAFITYWLYCGAICGKIRFNIKEIIIIVITIIVSFLVNEYSPTFAMHYSICAMLILPALFNGNIKRLALVYSVHGLSQILSMSIRNLPMLFSTYNSLIGLLMTIEMYFWLLLFYIIFNYRKKEI